MKLVTREYDIWSLGCLFLEFITWIVHGYTGVEEFEEVRLIITHENIIGDAFYNVIATDWGRQAEV